MLNDFDLIVHEFPDDLTIYPVADVHLGAVEMAKDKWEAFLKKVKDEDAYLILAGDLLNNSVRSAGFANPFDETMRPREAKRKMAEYLEPLRDRILCVVTGNHERRTFKDDDQDLTYDICSKLDVEHLYRENVAYMVIALGSRKNAKGDRGRSEVTYGFAVTHGHGGGIYTGAAINRDERFGNVIDGIDCFVTGHVHKGFISKPAKIVLDTHCRKVSMKHYTVISCVSWLNYGGYAAQRMLLPAQHSDPQKLVLSSNRHNKQIITTW